MSNNNSGFFGNGLSPAHQWELRGKIYFWRYLDNARNYTGWNLSLHPASAQKLTELFRLLLQEEDHCQRTLVVSAPTSSVLKVPNNQGGRARVFSPEKIRLQYVPDLDRQWNIIENDEVVIWRLGRAGASAVLGLLEDPDRDIDVSLNGDPAIWWWGTT